MKYSHQRELILEAVRSVKTHPTADAVYDMIHASEPSISLGTVYRNLNLLAEMGEITALFTSDDKVHYDGDTSSHRHFVCKGCGKIIDVFMDSDIPETLLKMGVVVEDVKTVYYGKCRECLKDTVS